ncbi:MAG: A24 family peptidase [Geminicoccales bacterium]
MPLYLCLAGLLTLLVLAALTDLRERRIPNWLTGGTAALYPLYVALSPTPVAWVGALGLAVLVFLVGLGLFARQIMGGGDVKLIAAVTLWAGLEQFVLFVLVTALTGGALGMICLWLQRWSGLIQAHLTGLGLAPSGGGSSVEATAPSSDAPVAEGGPGPITLPYGIAIAAGGVAVVVQLMKL